MKIYDVTLPITPGLPVWPGEPAPELVSTSSLAAGDQFNVTTLRLGSHTGTHLDAPRHIFAEGATVDQIPLELLVGDAWICRLPSEARLVTAELLEEAGIPRGTRRLLLATANAALWDSSPWSFVRDYVALSPDAAQWILSRGVDLVGVDYLSIEPFRDPEPVVHRTLLAQGVVVLEGLDLRQVPAGIYRLCCLPLKVVGADGAPARVLLFAE